MVQELTRFGVRCGTVDLQRKPDLDPGPCRIGTSLDLTPTPLPGVPEVRPHRTATDHGPSAASHFIEASLTWLDLSGAAAV